MCVINADSNKEDIAVVGADTVAVVGADTVVAGKDTVAAGKDTVAVVGAGTVVAGKETGHCRTTGIVGAASEIG